MDRQSSTLGIAGQLRSALASLPPARGLLPLILLLLVWQLVQPGPSPYFPGPSQWWTATLTLFSREHLVAAFGATTWTFLKGSCWRSSPARLSACWSGSRTGPPARCSRCLSSCARYRRR
jgi:ABC-type nitrate/sulfonate/bicarbonate transport system permease component